MTVSAGNNGAWGENVLTGTGMTYTTDVRMHTGGSPGSYTNSFTIASVTNTSMSGVMGKFNGVAAIPGDTGETYGATVDMNKTVTDIINSYEGELPLDKTIEVSVGINLLNTVLTAVVKGWTEGSGEGEVGTY